MCVDPVTAAAISAGVSGAQGVAQYSAQKQAAEQQKAAQQQASLREMKRQQMAMRSERMAQSEEETSMAQEQLKANREAQESISTSVTAAEAVNVAGTSVGLSIQEFERKNADYQAALALQSRMNDAARRLSMENMGQQYVTRMGQINQPIAKPNLLGIALSTASNMFSAYQTGQQAKSVQETAALQRDLYKAQLGTARQNLQISKLGTQAAAAQSGLYSIQRLSTR